MAGEADQLSFTDELRASVEAKFPLLGSMCLATQSGASPARIPFFVGLIAAVLESAEQPCCIVLPDKRGVSLAVSTVVAVARLQAEMPMVLRARASATLQPGDYVLVQPSGLVYEYQGFFNPEHFRLRVINRNASRSLPVRDIARLEKTSRTTPKGSLNSDLGKPHPTVLSVLAGVPGAVNRSLMSNHVVILGSIKALREQAADWQIATVELDSPLSDRLDRAIPLGQVCDDGRLEFFDCSIHSALGEPLIGIASRPEELAACCMTAAPKTKAVIVDDIERLVRNLQAYDSIAERQRVLVVADEAQHEFLSTLRDRGCAVWNLSPDEILLGIGDISKSDLFHGILRKAGNMRDLAVTALPCTNEFLDETAVQLCMAERRVRVANDNPSVRELFFTLFGTLMSCAEFLGIDAHAFATGTDARLDEALKLLKRAQMWLAPDVVNEIQLIVSKLRNAVSSLTSQPLSSKGSKLLEAIAACPSIGSIAVVMRSDRKRDELRQWLAARGIDVPVYGVNAVPMDQDFSELILLTWPSARRFDRLLRQYATQRLQVLAYGFERRWLKEYERAYGRVAAPQISTMYKRMLLGVLTNLAEREDMGHVPAQESVNNGHMSPFDLPSERFLLRRKTALRAEDIGEPEETCLARYVDFVGPTFAYITEGHELPIVNAFIRGNRTGSAAISTRSVEGLKIGDFVLFRNTGDSDIIRFIAEDQMGAKEYAILRAKAGRWREALLKVGSDPVLVWKKLRESGIYRHVATVRNWLCDRQMIAPKNFDDVMLIAEATGDKELIAELPEVQAASEEIKRRHRSAGFRLTELLREALPKEIEVPEDREIHLDLGFGNVWIVKVEDMEEATTECSRSLVNRLLWDSM
jgi:hypothetical protein